MQRKVLILIPHTAVFLSFWPTVALTSCLLAFAGQRFHDKVLCCVCFQVTGDLKIMVRDCKHNSCNLFIILHTVSEATLALREPSFIRRVLSFR